MAKLEPRPQRIHNHTSITDPEIVTQDQEMMRILDHAAKFAAGNMTILLTGETGTGKDLLAKRIHCLSARSGRQYDNHNMAQLPRDLADAELFGYEKNSHSRAERDKAGLIELANGGTLCLNEISELPLEMQSKLLLSLEESTIWRVGARCPIPVDVRFIAITNSDLREQVKTGRFREDLFHRLEGCHLHLPPLRERPGDLPLLLQYFLRQERFGEYDLGQTAIIVQRCGLDRYDWPGNVRELENVVGRSVVLAPLPNVAGLIVALSDDMRQQLGRRDGNSEPEKLLAALKRNKGNKSATAREFGIPLTTLCSRLKRYGIS
jgi:transcriptional regulator with PAS, ATPase and Fis domain